MTWGDFKSLLSTHTDKHLVFRYAENSLVDASYHITEIKLSPITSVDCGGKMNKWTEVIVQLWEPSGKSDERSMTVSKALSIVDVVENALPLDPTAIVKIEFGNSQFDTRQMYPSQLVESGDTLTVDLIPDFTQCKALGRGGSCGTTDNSAECCGTPEAKPKVELKNLAVSASCCEPGGGCC
jgi:hypothetical protein